MSICSDCEYVSENLCYHNSVRSFGKFDPFKSTDKRKKAIDTRECKDKEECTHSYTFVEHEYVCNYCGKTKLK